MNSKRLSELRYKRYITESEYKELKLALIALEKRPQGEWLTAGEEQGALGMIYKIKKMLNLWLGT